MKGRPLSTRRRGAVSYDVQVIRRCREIRTRLALLHALEQVT